jgi:hypothetical protein
MGGSMAGSSEMPVAKRVMPMDAGRLESHTSTRGQRMLRRSCRNPIGSEAERRAIYRDPDGRSIFDRHHWEYHRTIEYGRQAG